MRSQAVREEALRLDGSRCQITGADAKVGALLEVHHVIKLGMGGSDEKDVVENCITLEAHIHQMVESGALVIARWWRGMSYTCKDAIVHETHAVPAVLEVIDNQDILGHGIGRVDHSYLWFYRRKDAEEGEQILSQLSSFALLDATIAERVHRLGQVVTATDPDSRSLRECLASKGLDTRRLIGASSLWAKSLKDDFAWPDGVTVSDYRRMRKDAGLVKRREFYHVKLPKGWLLGARPPVWYRTAYAEELRDTMNPGDVLLGVNKFEYGYRAEGGDLYDPEGRKVDVIHFVPKEA